MRFAFLRVGRRGRSFAWEVAIIIVGVLIALALEQVASNWRERQRTSDLRASMHQEIADFADIFSLRMRITRCIGAKLDSLENVLARPNARGPWRDVGRAPFFFASQGGWNSDASDLLSRHLGPETFRTYGEVYQGIGQFMAISQQEQDQWIALQTLERQDEPVSGERRWRLVEAAAGARNANLLLTAIAEQMLANIDRLGIDGNETVSSSDIRSRPICQPLRSARPS
jgi:hypothetical protein